MRKLMLKRIAPRETYTIGKLYLDGEYICDTLEDTVRDLNNDGDLTDTGEKKVWGETAIPRGTYKVIPIISGKFGKTFWLQNVPSFSEILIHSGNTPEHTHGCVLVGWNKAKGMVLDSQKAMNILRDKLKNDTDIQIEIQ